MSRYSGRQVGGLLLTLAGLGIVGSGLLLNPWVAELVAGRRALGQRDVLGSYFFWSLVLGALNVALGATFAGGRHRRLDGVTVAVFLCSGVILLDRLVLVVLGLPLWTYDVELAYRNRPHKVQAFSGRSGLIRINRYGHHDDDFPVEKPAGEFRALMVGDSVTMGDGVPYEETFSSQLEGLLAGADRRHRSHQVINTGVHGYSTFQELRVLEESLVFDPDFVALGFCMNDVTEPFIRNTDFGGVGFGYQGILQSGSVVAGYLFNETGAGRLLQKVRSRALTREAEKLREIYGVEQMARADLEDPVFRPGWDSVLGSLEEVYGLVEERELPFLLMIFPFTFQLFESDALEPQRILREHATRHGIPVVDFTEVYRNLVIDRPEVQASLRAAGYSEEERVEFYTGRLMRYFRDADHLTAEGHRIVALALMRHLAEQGLIEVETPVRIR